MSLTSFIKEPDVKAKLESLRPKMPRKINAPLRVESRSPRYRLVGTAFDYLIRFELQRQAPHATTRLWIAEHVPALIWSPGRYSLVWREEPEAKHRADQVRAVVDSAKGAVASYRESARPSLAELADLAAHAVRLAKLDDFYRSRRRRFDPTFEVADPLDVKELLALLAVVPFDKLLGDKVMLLNPDFGESSGLVGGADADLITGDMLVDFKTTIKSETEATILDQLLGYYLLSRHRRRVDPTFPAINRVAIYFCRHGHLWTLDVDAWTGHQLFAEMEKWFFSRAKEPLGPHPRIDPVSAPLLTSQVTDKRSSLSFSHGTATHSNTLPRASRARKGESSQRQGGESELHVWDDPDYDALLQAQREHNTREIGRILGLLTKRYPREEVERALRLI
jgi:hypothetical protein